jgi:hypothetical protein
MQIQTPTVVTLGGGHGGDMDATIRANDEVCRALVDVLV